MLVRTGQYKGSWVNKNHPLHYHEDFLWWGEFHMIEGSKDPRVNRLSGGDVGDNLPPRPVAILETESFDRLDSMIIEIIEDSVDDISEI